MALEEVDEVAFESVLRVGCWLYCVGATLGAMLYMELARWSIMPLVDVAIALCVSPRERW